MLVYLLIEQFFNTLSYFSCPNTAINKSEKQRYPKVLGWYLRLWKNHSRPYGMIRTDTCLLINVLIRVMFIMCAYFNPSIHCTITASCCWSTGNPQTLLQIITTKCSLFYIFKVMLSWFLSNDSDFRVPVECSGHWIMIYIEQFLSKPLKSLSSCISHYATGSGQ